MQDLGGDAREGVGLGLALLRRVGGRARRAGARPSPVPAAGVEDASFGRAADASGCGSGGAGGTGVASAAVATFSAGGAAGFGSVSVGGAVSGFGGATGGSSSASRGVDFTSGTSAVFGGAIRGSNNSDTSAADASASDLPGLSVG